MENKLQELTDKLYNEGLTKGQQEAAKILIDAQNEAEHIIQQAQQKAAIIIEDAHKKAMESTSNADAEIRLAARQVQNEMKHAVENLVITHAVTPTIKEAFNDTAFVQSLIKTMSEKFNPQNADMFQLSVVLPENKQQELIDFVQHKMSAEMKNGLELKTDKRLKSGFKIGEKNGKYYVSLTDEDFDNLFKTYLRPKTRTLLFGDNR